MGELNLETRGNKDSLKARLLKAKKFNSIQDEISIPISTRPPGEEFERFLVFDVEATCEKLEGRLAFMYPNEIIEFPILLLQWHKEIEEDGQEVWSLVQIDQFHSYVVSLLSLL